MAVNDTCRYLGLSSFSAEKFAHFLLDLPVGPPKTAGTFAEGFEWGLHRREAVWSAPHPCLRDYGVR